MTWWKFVCSWRFWLHHCSEESNSPFKLFCWDLHQLFQANNSSSRQSASSFFWRSLSTTTENQANLMLSGKEGTPAPNENGDYRNELGAPGYSHQQHDNGCLGNATQFLGLVLFFSFKFRTDLHWLNQTKPMGGLFSKCHEGELVLYTSNYRERDIW